MIQFLKSEIRTISLFLINNFLFYLAFALFNQEMAVFYIIFSLLFLIFIIYLFRQLINYKHSLDLETKNEHLTQTIYHLKNQNRTERMNLEEYFLIWIHQIKTPITASYLILDDLQHKESSNLRKELIKIENYANLALQYLKITNPSTDLNITKVDLKQVIEKLIKRYRNQFISNHISLHLDIPKDALVVTDPNLTSIVIEQILSNALKYTERGDIWISFDKGTNNLTIKDSGIGIRTEDLKRIFEKGYSGYNGQLNRQSSGIGLYLVKLITRRLNQNVSVESKVGQGSTFTLGAGRKLSTPLKIRPISTKEMGRILLLKQDITSPIPYN